MAGDSGNVRRKIGRLNFPVGRGAVHNRYLWKKVVAMGENKFQRESGRNDYEIDLITAITLAKLFNIRVAVLLDRKAGKIEILRKKIDLRIVRRMENRTHRFLELSHRGHIGPLA